MAQSELRTEPKGSAQAKPEIRTELWLSQHEKFDFTFWLISGLT